MKQYTKTEFFEEFGWNGLIVKVNEDDAETGDYQLFCPEEQDIAKEWQDKGYEIASVFEMEDSEDIVIIDNDLGSSHHKIGYIIIGKN
jgi:hypothetical protein